MNTDTYKKIENLLAEFTASYVQGKEELENVIQ